jgi:hypothetical protein
VERRRREARNILFGSNERLAPNVLVLAFLLVFLTEQIGGCNATHCNGVFEFTSSIVATAVDNTYKRKKLCVELRETTELNHMDLLHQFIEYQNNFLGHAPLKFVHDHSELPVFAVGLYVMFIFQVSTSIFCH